MRMRVFWEWGERGVGRPAWTSTSAAEDGFGVGEEEEKRDLIDLMGLARAEEVGRRVVGVEEGGGVRRTLERDPSENLAGPRSASSSFVGRR